ncbi:extracellular solute-binding protein [Paenibacillus allorhizosphaerae]|uniref:Lipoprotein LipO n=1 Tax=Paenibacillus allorhizosphaerae TaxID=2849866 RepID=A0ABN7TGL5_9BACL|nr:extracellular solute-binding protein [Paenibacillus allorhizosphaerae]CAG7619084.1 Lipoprotein LipO [Paenibacillus allorhizosphaerae]
MKKMFSTTIAISLLLGVAAGCVQRDANLQNADVSTEEPDEMSENIRIDMVIASWKGGGWPDNNHPTIKYINHKFNVDLQIQWVPNANYAEKLNVIAASGKMPDVIRIDSPNLFLKWANQGVFLDIQPYLPQYPQLKRISSPEEWGILNPKGKIYGIPIHATSQNTIYVRADWLHNLGIELPGNDEFTIDRFYEMAKAFTTQDPDGNGKQDTVGFSVLGNSIHMGMPELLASFGIANGWQEKDGQLIPTQIQSEEWKSFLTFMRKAYEEGVLDKDFMTNTNFNEKYAQGKVGFADMHYQLSRQTNQQLQSIAPNARFVELSPPIGKNGMRGNTTPTSGMIKVVLSKDVNEKKRNRILSMFDWWVSAEGEQIIKNGIEGYHYKKLANGSYEMTDALKAEGEGRQSLLWNWVLRSNSNTFNIYRWSDPVWAKEMEQSIANAGKYPYKNAGDAYIDSSASFAEKGKPLADKFQKTLIEIIAGKKPVESIDDAIAQWKRDGGQKIMDEVNAAYKANQ